MSEWPSRGGLDLGLPDEGEPQRWFAVAAPGLEEIVAAEVRPLPGATAVTVVEGGVEFRGALEVGMRANLWLRVATRVLLRVATVRAREFPALRRLLARLPWERWVAAGDPLRVQASASSSRLYHTGALAEALTLAVGERLVARGGKPPTLAPRLAPGARRADDEDARRGGGGDTRDGRGGGGAGGGSAGDAGGGGGGAGHGGGDEGPTGAPETRVLLRGVADRWTVSIDSSGQLLHRRGWRTEAGRAPLRETVAAAVLQLAGYDPARPLLDPMCGSGTITLEAASLAAGRPPGLGRDFAFQRWPGFDQPRWQALLDESAPAAAGGEMRRPAAPIFAWDRDRAAVSRARRNAERAALDGHIGFAEATFGAGGAGVEPPEALASLQARTGGAAGLLLINPPYGRRLGSPVEAVRLLKTIGRTLRTHFPAWRAGVLLADARWASALGLPLTSRAPIPSGGLRLTLALVEVPARPGSAPE